VSTPDPPATLACVAVDDGQDPSALRPSLLKRNCRRTGLFVELVGVGHLVLAVVLFAGPLRDIVSGGVIASVPFNERASEEAAAVWFTESGALLIILGQVSRVFQANGGRLPPSPGWLFIAIGATGAAVAPISGFWVYLGLGSLWVSDSRA